MFSHVDHRRALGAVAGIVGAGGNLGAVLAGFLFKTPSPTYSQALMVLGTVVAACSVAAFAVRLTEKDVTPLAGEMAAVTAVVVGDSESRFAWDEAPDSFIVLVSAP